MDTPDFEPTALEYASHSPPHKQRAEMPPQLPAKKPNLSWRRRKDEIQRLRAETQALETHRMFLQMRRTHDAILHAGLSEGQRRWKDAAEVEKRRCELARDENAQLKDKLQSCVRACNDLQTVLYVAGTHQSKALLANTLAGRALQTELSTGHHQLLNSDVINVLESRLNEKQAELDALCHAALVSAARTDTDDVHVRRKGVEGASAMVEFTRDRLLPFDIDHTSRVFWGVMNLGVMPDGRSVRVTRHADDIVASQGCESFQLECGGSVELRLCCLMKRVVLPGGGFVVLIESTTEWIARPSRAKWWTHVTQDSGSALVQPCGLKLGTCRFQIGMRLQTQDPAASLQSTLLTPSVSDIVIPSVRKVISSQHQLLENALLDSAATLRV
ncbi:hypothetical protein KRP22_014372 [Phytophthora ramorum]|nr:hypothetical protein KRP22_9024 [Phytophthora ramorum]